MSIRDKLIISNHAKIRFKQRGVSKSHIYSYIERYIYLYSGLKKDEEVSIIIPLKKRKYVRIFVTKICNDKFLIKTGYKERYKTNFYS